MDQVKEEDLRYAASARCKCGAGLAYIKDRDLRDPMGNAWFCSDLLLKAHEEEITVKQNGGLFGGGTLLDESGTEHDQNFPFTTFEIKSEDQPSAYGATTRPEK